ncbi:alpha-glucosidase [Pseudogulbenkiania ferrooxidans]|uniref:Alpha amylase catalytic region n=1 Tax=Pseudogulbenkiania ferrooxidans 2002 TaxID=279714 RepID=B9Z801_9NEIS|nr:alpha-glucosidase [Pseudogulbenkiania ferrooxidans]EEG07056.1 alpha amylase catalytic region [Pseudogulbenkiania ferrooxidans 2002]
MKSNGAWWRGGVIYQIYPRSFADSNGDGVGDLPGIIEHLPYVASLSVDAIWVSPFFKSPMKDFGYDVSDYRAVDPLFGHIEDFRRLVTVAHELGLKVMIDQVLSHTSEEHAWFKESRVSRDNPRANWYVWADANADGTPPNNWLSVFGGSSWQWDTRRRQYYLHNFLASQPDLNFHELAVQEAILAEVRFWLELGVDGLRFDACNFHFHDPLLRSNPAAEQRDNATVTAGNPYSYQSHQFDKSQPENLPFLKRLRSLLDEYGAVALGEIGDDDSLARMAEYTAGNDKLHMAYSFNLLTPEFSAAHIRRQVEELEAQIGSGWACWTTGNHDSIRVLTRWGRNVEHPRFSRTILAMLLSLRGSACLYQGEELALPEAELNFEQLQDPYGIAMWPEFKGRDGCRTPMPWRHDAPHGGFSSAEPWLPVPAGHLARAADKQDAEADSVLQFYRRFIPWRRSQTELVSGNIRFLDGNDAVLAFTRDDRVVAVFNLSAAPQTLTLPFDVVALDGHGLDGAVLQGHTLELDAWGGWFGRIGR